MMRLSQEPNYGDTYGPLTITRYMGVVNHRRTWECKCVCHKVGTHSLEELNNLIGCATDVCLCESPLGVFQTPKKPANRPSTWASKITAPSLAVEFYQLLAKLATSDAFNVCHVIHAPTLNGKVPVIKWKGKVRGVSNIAAGYLGTPNSKQTCDTLGCVNPFHYLPVFQPETQLVSANTLPPPLLPPIPIEDYAELVTSTIDDNAMRAPTFLLLRPLLHPEDISDEMLKMVLKHLNIE